MVDLTKARAIMGEHFIGPEELERIADDFGICRPRELDVPVPQIRYSERCLRELKDNSILILGAPCDRDSKPLTINRMRRLLGTDPDNSEPCFYNQDWYLREDFAGKRALGFDWYVISRNVKEESRGHSADDSQALLSVREQLPSAVLTAFTFFANYLLNGEVLWKHDFIWCQDTDHNADRVYTGRYIDPLGINKNGFNVHRYLKISSFYGTAPQIVA
jgi:hypothetical protein